MVNIECLQIAMCICYSIKKYCIEYDVMCKSVLYMSIWQYCLLVHVCFYSCKLMAIIFSSTYKLCIKTIVSCSSTCYKIERPFYSNKTSILLCIMFLVNWNKTLNKYWVLICVSMYLLSQFVKCIHINTTNPIAEFTALYIKELKHTFPWLLWNNLQCGEMLFGIEKPRC